MKLKVKPSAKINRRYLLLNAKDKSSVEKVILDYIGMLGWAKAVPHFVENLEKKLILAIERKSLEDIRAAFEISSEKIKIQKVSGTLKGLKK